jgi:hypothetical protein
MLERGADDIVVVPEEREGRKGSRASARVLECPSHQAKL